MARTYSVVIGLGEVGKSLMEVLMMYDIMGFDKQGMSFLPKGKCEVLNICIPYSNKFIEIVNEYIKYINPGLTINHSTVPVGTTSKLNGLVVHSPVRGRHPDLVWGLKHYIKFIGYNTDEARELCEKYYDCVFRFKSLKTPESTELGKLLSLARYGVALAFANEQDKICKVFGQQYDEVVEEWDVTHNEGIVKMGDPHLQRSILYPPEGKIGGHCVTQNVKELNRQYPSPFFEEVLKLA